MRPLPDASADIDRRVAALERLEIGRFRCAPDHSRFANSGPSRGWLIVFPRTSVWITHAGEAPVLADPSLAMLYNDGQEYTRATVGGAPDRCEWFSYASDLVAEAVARFDPAAIDRLARPFGATHAPVDARTYALQRSVFEHVTTARAVDLLFVEESSLAILARVTAAAHRGRARQTSAGTPRAHAALVDAVRCLLATRLDEPLSLSAIAREVERSPFHVARVFQARVGVGVHAYRNELRLRASLERVLAGDDLTSVALDLGFSSHSHFTRRFAATFGAPPRSLRDGLARKNVQAERRLDRRR